MNQLMRLSAEVGAGFSVLSNLWQRLDRPNLKMQLAFLSEISAYRMTGDVEQIDRRINTLPAFKRRRQHFPQITSGELSLSRKLELLGFADQIVAALNAAERAGDLDRGLETAMTFCSLTLEIREKTSGKLYLGALLLIMSLFVLYFIPARVVAPLEDLLLSPDLSIRTNFATNIVLFLASSQFLVLAAVSAIVAVGAVAYATRDDWLDLSAARVALALPINYCACKRSLRFLLAWRIYKPAGLPIDSEENSDALRRALGERIYERVNLTLADGGSLADAIAVEPAAFSPILNGPMAAIAGLGEERFTEIADRLIGLLLNEQKRLSGQLAVLFNVAGAVITIGTILLIAFGVIFPVMSLSSGVL